MNWPDILDHLAGHRYATADDVRKIFADYHDALYWLAGFLIGDELAASCVIDACKIAERQGAIFHEWLAHWAARATLRCALHMQRKDVAECAPEYERFERVHTKRSPLSAEDLQVLVEECQVVRARLDVLCRYALIMHGIAKEPYEEVAAQLGVSQSTVERAYCVAFDALHLVSETAPQFLSQYVTDVPNPGVVHRVAGPLAGKEPVLGLAPAPVNAEQLQKLG